MTGSSREFYGTGTNFFRYRYRYFFPGPIFSGTGTGTFFRDQIFSVPVPVLFSGTKFFRYRYRYFFPGPIFSGTGTSTSKKEQNSRDREFPGPGCHTLLHRWNFVTRANKSDSMVTARLKKEDPDFPFFC